MKSIHELVNLTGKTALVTGGAVGIGFGIARRLAEAGAHVIIADMNQNTGECAAEELKEQRLDGTFVKTDVSNEADIRRAIEQAVAEHGSLDILVNNAGIYPIEPVLQMTAETFDTVLAVNLKSVFYTTKLASEQMISQGKGGKIINVTSIDALHPSSVGLAAYDASKHGLWGFTKNAALELAPHGITVNAIAPGGIMTPGTGADASSAQMTDALKKFAEMIPMKRMGEPDDIGKVALFLASDLSSYMTGAQIVVDGGRLLS